jgi:hypothetical protein
MVGWVIAQPPNVAVCVSAFSPSTATLSIFISCFHLARSIPQAGMATNVNAVPSVMNSYRVLWVGGRCTPYSSKCLRLPLFDELLNFIPSSLTPAFIVRSFKLSLSRAVVAEAAVENSGEQGTVG